MAKDMKEYRKAQLKAISILVELSGSVSMGWTGQGKKQCVALAVCLNDMEKAAEIKGPQCLPAIQDEKENR